MKRKTILILLMTHCAVAAFGFAAGIYTLPILVAPPAPTNQEIEQVSSQALFSGQFTRDREGSDALHWGEGEIYINSDSVSFMGKLSPGPDYKLYLSPEFVETESDFEALKMQMALVSDVKTFENFQVQLPKNINPENYTTAVIWCETFGEFITSAKYR